MSVGDLLWNIPSQYHEFTVTEEKILETIIGMKSSNAYAIWKTSGLKHYPTVLRLLKKLHEKRLIQVRDQKGIRGETIYASTLAAVFLLYSVKEESKKLNQVIANNSDFFRELATVEKGEWWALSVAREIIEDAVTAKKQRDINEVLRDKVEEMLQDTILNISYNNNAQRIARLARIKWIRDLIIAVAEGQMEESKQHINELEELQKRLQ
jgi:hypothetical protein